MVKENLPDRKRNYFDSTEINKKLRNYIHKKFKFYLLLLEEQSAQNKVDKLIEDFCMQSRASDNILIGRTNKFFSITENAVIALTQINDNEKKELIRDLADSITGIEAYFLWFRIEDRYLLELYINKLEDNTFTWSSISKEYKKKFDTHIEISTVYRRIYTRILPRLDRLLKNKTIDE